MKKSLIFLSIFVLVAVFGLAQMDALNAQTISAAGSDVAVEFSPSAPGPNQNVVATASSFSVDLNSAGIAWLVNGKVH